MTKKILKDTLLWGSTLWLVGYILGIVLFFIVSQSLIGWVITPIGILFTVSVLLTKIQGTSMKYFLVIACSWTLIAIIFDYLFLVKVFSPADGYYKLDVYLYYGFTFILPLLIGWKKIFQT